MKTELLEEAKRGWSRIGQCSALFAENARHEISNAPELEQELGVYMGVK